MKMLVGWRAVRGHDDGPDLFLIRSIDQLGGEGEYMAGTGGGIYCWDGWRNILLGRLERQSVGKGEMRDATIAESTRQR